MTRDRRSDVAPRPRDHWSVIERRCPTHARPDRHQQPAPLADPRAHRRRAADGRARRDDREHRAALGPGGLGFSDESRQWVVTAYALSFGSLLLLGGRLGDLFGRKRVFIVGLAGFAAASALGGFATSFGVLVGARALQGAFAALLAPAALSLLTTTFTIPEERNRAFSVFGVIGASGAAVGLILGGALTEFLDWRWTMFVNLVLAVPAAVAALRLLPDDVVQATPVADRPARHADGVGRPVRARLRLLQRRVRRLGRAADDRRPRRRRRPARGVRRRRAPRRAPAAAAARRRRPRPRRRLPRHRRRRRRDVRRLPVPHLLHAADPRLLAARVRPGVPADDGGDHAGRRDRPDPPAAALRRRGRWSPPACCSAPVAMLMLTGVSVDSSYAHRRAARPAGDGPRPGPDLRPRRWTRRRAASTGADAGVASALVNTGQQVGGSIGTALLSTLAASAAGRVRIDAPAAADVAAQAAVHGYTTAFTWAAGDVRDRRRSRRGCCCRPTRRSPRSTAEPVFAH